MAYSLCRRHSSSTRKMDSACDAHDAPASLVLTPAALRLNDVWRRKLGLVEWTEASAAAVATLLELMDKKADYTIFWRQLACVVAAVQPDEKVLCTHCMRSLSHRIADKY